MKRLAFPARQRFWLSLALGASFCAPTAAAQLAGAQQRVLVLGDGDRPGFVAALQIQLAGQSEVELTREEDRGPQGPASVAAASARVLEEGLRAAVWLEMADAHVVLYVVGRRADRASVEVVEVDAVDSSDFDRSLALRVAGILDAADRPPDAPRLLEGDGESDGEGSWAETTGPWGLRGQLHLQADGAAGTAPWLASFGGGVGVSYAAKALRLVATLGVDGAFPYDHRAEAPGRVTSSEVRPWLSVRGLYSAAGAIRFGLEAQGELRLATSEGTTARGAAGSATNVVPELRLLGVVEWPIAGGFGLSAGAGLALSLVEQRLLINDVAAASLGRFRFRAQVAAIFDTFL